MTSSEAPYIISNGIGEGSVFDSVFDEWEGMGDGGFWDLGNISV